MVNGSVMVSQVNSAKSLRWICVLGYWLAGSALSALAINAGNPEHVQRICHGCAACGKRSGSLLVVSAQDLRLHMISWILDEIICTESASDSLICKQVPLDCQNYSLVTKDFICHEVLSRPLDFRQRDHCHEQRRNNEANLHFL